MRTWLFALCFLVAGSVQAQTVAIRAGNLIDTTNGTVSKNQIILVKDKNRGGRPERNNPER